MVGEYERGKVPTLTPFKDRKAREVFYKLLEAGLLVSETERGKVRLGFPMDVVESWFPQLYPALGNEELGTNYA